MSTDSNTNAIEAFRISSYAITAVIALVSYEHLITFKYEIDILRRWKWSASTWIFMFNRYFMITSIIYPVVPPLSLVCSNSTVRNMMMYFTDGELSTLPAHAFTILRVFALLQDHSWRLTAICILSGLTLVVFTLNTFVTFTVTWVSIQGSGCYPGGYSVPPRVISSALEAGSVFGIIVAVFVLVFTLAKTVRQVRQASTLRLKTTLSTILLRDGSMFFLLILVVDIIGALPSLNGSGLSGIPGYILQPIISILPHICLSRFLINLRQIDVPTVNSSVNPHTSRFSAPNFRRPTMDEFVGNLGEPLDFVEYRLDDEDEDETPYEDYEADTRQQHPEEMFGTASDFEAAASPSGESGGGYADERILTLRGEQLEEPRPSPVLPV